MCHTDTQATFFYLIFFSRDLRHDFYCRSWSVLSVIEGFIGYVQSWKGDALPRKGYVHTWAVSQLTHVHTYVFLRGVNFILCTTPCVRSSFFFLWNLLDHLALACRFFDVLPFFLLPRG